MDDSTGSEPDLEQDPQVKALLRVASFGFPLIVSTLALVLVWRSHFSKNALLSAALTILFSIYFGIYCYRRSRGLSASFGNVSPGPDRDWSYNDQCDVGAIWGAVIFMGSLVYMVIKYW